MTLLKIDRLTTFIFASAGNSSIDLTVSISSQLFRILGMRRHEILETK